MSNVYLIWNGDDDNTGIDTVYTGIDTAKAVAEHLYRAHRKANPYDTDGQPKALTWNEHLRILDPEWNADPETRWYLIPLELNTEQP